MHLFFIKLFIFFHRPPKRRGGLNTRYTLLNEDDNSIVERPRTTTPVIRPRPNRAWEFGISPKNDDVRGIPAGPQGAGSRVEGAVGGVLGAAYGNEEPVRYSSSYEV